MSFALLAPIGLAALAALALPIVIHLVRRIELRTTEFAALRWISERIRPRRRLRFERPWLLLLRLSLLALFALLLARPIFTEPSIAKPAWVVVAPGSELGAARAAVSIDAVSMENADWHWLAPGFPPIESPAPSASVPIASLLREIDADLPGDTKLAVVVPEEIAGFDGERPTLSHDVDWRVVPGHMATDAALQSRGPIELAVRYAPSAEPMLKYLRAAVAALDARESTRFTLDAQLHDVALGGSGRELVWLGSDLPPVIKSWIEAGGTALVDNQPRAVGAPIWRDADGDVLARVQTLGSGRLVTLSAAFSPQGLPALLDADFPQHLFDLLQGPPPAPTRAPASALRPKQETSATTSTMRTSAKPLDPWLVLLIASLFLVERVVATRTPAST